jgi:hypothetical protein
MEHFDVQELRMEPFEMVADGRVELSIIGARNREADQLFALGWILQADSREVVWSMSEASTRRILGEKKLRKFEGSIYLEKGRYEAYYYAGNPLIALQSMKFEIKLDDVGDVAGYVAGLLGDEFRDNPNIYSEMTRQYSFSISSSAKNFKMLDYDLPEYDLSFLSIVKPRNLTDEKHGFEVLEKIPVEIYAFGEYSEGDDIFVDGSKLINAQTRDMVWAMERWNTDWQGGAMKNRCFHDEITLPPGEYILHYWTDDSHTFDAWNAPPPYDPYFYGVTLALAEPEDQSKVRPTDIEERKQVLVQITKAGNNANLSRPFELKRDVRAIVYSLGEGKKGILYDYGWIEKNKTGEKIWVMQEEETDHAGGAKKNRVFDGVLDLPRGEYLLRYKSDGSHSFRSWNAAPPSDSRHYGITLYTYGAEQNGDIVEVGPLKNLNPSGAPGVPQFFYQGDVHVFNEQMHELNIELAELYKEMAELQYDYESEMAKHDRNNLDDIHELREEYSEDRKELTDEIKKLKKKLAQNRNYSVVVNTPEAPPKSSVPAPEGDNAKYIVKLCMLPDNTRKVSTFSLDKPTRVRVYAAGEGVDGKMYDYGWIENKNTGQIIWEMTYRKTVHAGGASKNRMVNDIILLDKGTYEAHYVTDDSHSYNNWNAGAPADPQSWGIAIILEDDAN